MKIIFIFPCSGMFRHVPEFSGMFHVPGFVDTPLLLVALKHYPAKLLTEYEQISKINFSFFDPF